jgi:hypothetical protein
MGVPECRNSNSGKQVEIFNSLGVVQADALASHERNRLPPIRLQHMSGFERLNV